MAPAFPFVHLTNSVLFSQLAAARDKLYLKFNYSDVHEAFANVPSQILGLNKNCSRPALSVVGAKKEERER